MMPLLLDPGWVSTEPMPVSTGTKLQGRQRYYRNPESGQLYFRDTDGTLYELKDISAMFPWPEELTRDGKQQMALADGEDGPRRTGAARARAFRERRRSQRPDPHAGPIDFAQAEKVSIP